jgi:hypothetical protein
MADNEKLIELYKKLKRNEIQRLVSITRKLQSKYGPQVADDIAEVLTEGVHERWNKMDKGEAGLYELCELMWEGKDDLFDKVIEIRDKDELRLKINRCFFADEYRKLDALDLGYKYSCMCEYPAVDVFNPRIRFKRSRTLMQDHGYCDHCYKIMDKNQRE